MARSRPSCAMRSARIHCSCTGLTRGTTIARLRKLSISQMVLYPAMETTKSAASIQPIMTLLICGQEISESDRRRIRLAAAHPGLVIQEFNHDMMSCIVDADMVDSTAGYNTN